MNHSFNASQAKPDECITCKRNARAHGPLAQCEVCPKIGTCEIMSGDILMCPACQLQHAPAKDVATPMEATDGKGMIECVKCKKPFKINGAIHRLCPSCLAEETKNAIEYVESGQALQVNLIGQIDMLARAARVDEAIRFPGEFFNAETISIAELKSAIDADETLSPEEKHYKLAKLVHQRFIHFQNVLFPEKKKELEAMQGSMRAQQQYLNNLVSKLKEEKRAEFKAHDIHYAPPAVSKEKPVTAPKVRMTAEDKLVANFMKLKGIEDKDEAIKKMKAVGML